MAQGSPAVEGLPANELGKRFVRTISTPVALQGDMMQRTTPCAFGELKHGSKMSLPLIQRQASFRPAARDSFQHEPRRMLVIRTVGVPELENAW
jgi:hypothetical protein